jgi:predicted membrane channel-forming protein YqfA (hemolysin III family)
MAELLLNRTTVIGLAVIGGVLSVLASWCQSQNLITQHRAAWLNRIAYAFMAASMVLFIAAGLFDFGQYE